MRSLLPRLTLLAALLATFFLHAADSLSGKWTMVMDTPGGERRATPTLALDGENVTGTWDSSEVKGTFKEGRLELEFPLSSSEAGYKAIFKVSR